MHNGNPRAMLSPEARLSFPALFKARPPFGRPDAPQDEWKYECTLLVPKSESAWMNELSQTIEHVVSEAVADNGPRGWKGARPPQLQTPVQDGDAPKKDGTPRPEAERGHWLIKIKGKRKPTVRSAVALKGPDLTEAECYAGCYVRATFNVGAYNTAGNKGVTFYLGNILKTRDGEPFGAGATAAEDDFAGLEQAPAIGDGMGLFG